VSFPKYPEYKDSGVEWLGDVPAHWCLERLKRISSVIPSNVDKKAYEGQGAVRLCNYTDVYYNDEITAEIDFMEATASEDEIRKFTLRAGDTIITKDSESADDIGIPAYVPQDLPGVVCGYHLTILRPNPGVNGKFIKRLFETPFLKARFAVSANGLTRVGLSQYAIDNTVVPVAPVDEQSTIAAFLDHETARIDALVEEQKRLIELLKEKRQAVISHAVTKGLDPNVPMKDSGVEWLGEVPAHWEVVSLGLLVERIQTGPFGSQLHQNEYVEDQTPVINPSNISDGTITPDYSNTVSPEVVDRLSHQRLESGDIVLGRRGEMGRCAVVGKREEGWLCGTGSMRISLGRKLLPEFVASFIRTPFVRDVLQLESVGSTMDNLNPEIISRLKISVPPLDEQIAIINGLRLKVARLAELLTEADKVIGLLKEHRSALISSAVTGKIDVRGWEPPATSQATAENAREPA
jgi:type I restriction enzyme, S subunit